MATMAMNLKCILILKIKKEKAKRRSIKMMTKSKMLSLVRIPLVLLKGKGFQTSLLRDQRSLPSSLKRRRVEIDCNELKVC